MSSNGDLVDALAGEDGVLELPKVLAAARIPVRGLTPGPRRWALSWISADGSDDQVDEVALGFHTADGRSAVIAQAAALPPLELAERVATPLALDAWRSKGLGNTASFAVSRAASEAVWRDGGAPPRPGVGAALMWAKGHLAVGDAPPVRLAAAEDGAAERLGVVLATLGVAEEEVDHLLSSVAVLEPGDALARELQVGYRRHLAQRWWDAPRQPYRPYRR